VARPRLLSPEVIADVARRRAVGETWATVADGVGVSVSTVQRAVARVPLPPEPEPAQPPPPPAAAASVDALRADPRFEATLLAGIARSSSWQAKAWLLERMHPERWARPPTREVESAPPPAGGPDDPFAWLDELAPRRRDR
jgi:hypothetical protein